MTLYQTFANNDAIVEAVLRELERFLYDLVAEDKLVEGFVFTLTTLLGHALLLATEAETVLLFLTVEGDGVIRNRIFLPGAPAGRWRCPMTTARS